MMCIVHTEFRSIFRYPSNLWSDTYPGKNRIIATADTPASTAIEMARWTRGLSVVRPHAAIANKKICAARDVESRVIHLAACLAAFSDKVFENS